MKFSIIGFGNLGKALAHALINSKSAKPEEIYIFDKSPEALALAKDNPFNLNALTNINLVITKSDFIFLALKGYVFEEISDQIDKTLLKGKTVVSFMAGETFENIYKHIGDDLTLVRAMPSLAIAFLEGVIGYTKAPPELSEVFHRFGYALETEPENVEKFMAFSACGLGYAAYLIDAFAVAGENMGFSVETAAEIAGLTFKNAVERGGFKGTVKAVATPGGATEQGVNYMDDCHVHEIVAQAIQKAYERYTLHSEEN